MVDFAAIRAKAQELHEVLKTEITKKENQSKDKVDWSLTKFKPKSISKLGKTVYKIRFLPNMKQNDGVGSPSVLTYTHDFIDAKGGKHYTMCPTTFDKAAKCPVCERAKTFWDKMNKKIGTPKDEEQARHYSRKPRYYANVLVVEDPRTGEANQAGKVLVYDYSKSVQTIITEFSSAGNLYYLPDSNNIFNLTVKTKGDYPNFELSDFDEAASPIAATEQEINEILGRCYDLKNASFSSRGAKSYEEILMMLNGDAPAKVDGDTGSEIDSDTGLKVAGTASEVDTSDLPKMTTVQAEKVQVKNTAASKPVSKPVSAVSDDDLLEQLNAIDLGLT